MMWYIGDLNLVIVLVMISYEILGMLFNYREFFYIIYGNNYCFV